jgi:hypothetical protein
VQGDLPQPTGWTFFDLSAEFQRQGVPNKHWAACSLNTDYRWALLFRERTNLKFFKSMGVGSKFSGSGSKFRFSLFRERLCGT